MGVGGGPENSALTRAKHPTERAAEESRTAGGEWRAGQCERQRSGFWPGKVSKRLAQRSVTSLVSSTFCGDMGNLYVISSRFWKKSPHDIPLKSHVYNVKINDFPCFHPGFNRRQLMSPQTFTRVPGAQKSGWKRCVAPWCPLRRPVVFLVMEKWKISWKNSWDLMFIMFFCHEITWKQHVGVGVWKIIILIIKLNGPRSIQPS